MQPILDPRAGDIEDDASSTKRRSLLSLAGTLLGEISFPKLAIVWMMLIGFPGLMLGAAPLLVSFWVASVSSHAAAIFTEVVPALVLLALTALAWFAWRPLLRLAESSFWSLNALAVQPAYIAFREGFRHLAERLLRSSDERGPARLRPRRQRRRVGSGHLRARVRAHRPRVALDALGRRLAGFRVASPAAPWRVGEQRCAGLRLFRARGAWCGAGPTRRWRSRATCAHSRPALAPGRRWRVAHSPTSIQWANDTVFASRAAGPVPAATSG